MTIFSLHHSVLDADTREDLVRRSRFGRKQAVRSDTAMAITDSPLATRAATDVLRAGGSCVDAALAACAVQVVVHPDMTSMTGVLSGIHRSAATGVATYCNATPNAPKMPLGPIDETMMSTGKSVLVPGWWAGFDALLERFGTRTRAELLAPAIGLAREGFEVSPHVYSYVRSMLTYIARYPQGREIYLNDGVNTYPYEVWKQPQLAGLLERLADGGSEEFYRGETAEKLIATLQAAGGVMTMDDLDSYEVRWEEPARGTYHGHEILGGPPPDNGGSVFIELLNLVELLDVKAMGHPLESAETLFELMRLTDVVMSDSAAQGDPQTHDVPLDILLSKGWAEQRLRLIRMGAPRAPQNPVPTPGSCQVTVVDANGDIFSCMNSSMATPWRNGLFVDGMSLGASAAHMYRHVPLPGQRQPAYINSNIVLRDGKPVLVSGSPAMALHATILQNTLNIVDYGMSIEESIHLPRFGITEGPGTGQMIEADVDPTLVAAVRARGLAVGVTQPWWFGMGSFDGIHLDPTGGGLEACADPRRGGMAEGL